MDAQPILLALEFSHRALTLNLQDVTHRESLVQPSGGGNCINWILGHILVHRDQMLSLLGEPPLLDEATSERYGRGSAPITGGDGAQPFDRLRGEMDASAQRVRDAVSRAGDRLNEPAGKRSVGEMLLFLAGHEMYHCGQIGVVRRIAGMAGAIQ